MCSAERRVVATKVSLLKVSITFISVANIETYQRKAENTIAATPHP
jgi:hypothetical protein